MDTLKKMMMMVMMFVIVGCGEEPGEAPTVPDPVVWTGNILIHASIHISPDSTVLPDSVSIMLDRDSLGVISNFDTLKGISEGRHTIQCASNWNGLLYRTHVQQIQVNHNVGSVLTAYLTRSGSLAVIARHKGIDTPFILKLGSDTLDLRPFPAPPEQEWVEFSPIPQGSYNVTAYWNEDSISIEGWRQNVVIEAAERTDITIDLIEVAPDSGAHAPGMEALDLDGNTWSLADHWGKVIYLYFYEST